MSIVASAGLLGKGVFSDSLSCQSSQIPRVRPGCRVDRSSPIRETTWTLFRRPHFQVILCQYMSSVVYLRGFRTRRPPVTSYTGYNLHRMPNSFSSSSISRNGCVGRCAKLCDKDTLDARQPERGASEQYLIYTTPG